MATIYGTEGNDALIAGTDQSDQMAGLGGNDVLAGYGGADAIDGGTGNDTLYGDTGNDDLYGWTGDDLLDGGTGNDRLFGEDGNDGLISDAGDDVMDGGSGRDLAHFEYAAAGVTLDLGRGTAFGNATGSDVLVSVEDAYGSVYADAIYGGSASNWLNGLAGNDTVYGEGANDTLYGDTGDDDLYGGDGADTLFGDAGTDYLYGDSGNDTLYGGAGNDVLFGDAGTDTVRYLGGRNEYSLGRAGSVWSVRDLVGTDGVDQLNTVERAQFADLGVAFDTGASQSAGQAALLVGAVLGHSALAAKKTLVGDVIDLFDQGYTMSDLSGAVMRLDIWGILANGGQPTASTEQIATYLFSTVYGVAPYPSEVADAVYYMNNTPQGAYLAALAASAANQSQVGLIGLAETGLEFGL